MNTLNNAPLGKQSSYISTYTPELLFPIPRAEKRKEIGINGTQLPFVGEDLWNAYEISWLNKKGKPEVAIGQFIIPCDSPNIIESKSLKLYLNSFNQTKFSSIDEVSNVITKDLSTASGKLVQVTLSSLDEYQVEAQEPSGTCLDTLDIECNTYQPKPDYLTTEKEEVTETLYSNLLKSNCLVTGQPDWGSIFIQYTGKKINHANLLKYIVSLREHNEFHEQCVERIYMNINKKCLPKQLSVSAFYTRRGGIDINPHRSSYNSMFFKPERKPSRQ